MYKTLASLALSSLVCLSIGCGIGDPTDQAGEGLDQQQSFLTSCTSGCAAVRVSVHSTVPSARSLTVLDATDQVLTSALVPANSPNTDMPIFCEHLLDRLKDKGFPTDPSIFVGVDASSKQADGSYLAPVTLSPVSGSCNMINYMTPYLAITNPAGINAPVLPDLSLPPVVFKSAGFPPKAQTVRYNATASDACGASVPITCTPASGSVFPLGGTTVSCSATNASGTATGSFTVIVS